MKKSIIILFLSSCALLGPKKPLSTPQLITGGSDIAKLSSDEMAKQLTRDTTMGGGIFELQATPLSRALMQQRWQELNSSRGYSPHDLAKTKSWHLSRFIESKTCIDFHYSVTRFEETKFLSNWKLILELEGEQYDMTWLEQPAGENIFVSQIATPTHMARKWHNQAIACTSTELPIEKGFTLKVLSAYVPWPFSSESSMEWFFQPLTKEDEAALIERQKKKQQKYRGW
tara:strand:+ start:10093 stop:10779 length:687 start_codon:yes stop_codon:yes gene_type:complete